MGVSIETLDILLSTVFTTLFYYFFAVERFYKLTVYRLSEEIATLPMVIKGLFDDTKITI